MVIYHAVSTYQLLNCIVHALANHADEQRILILPSFISRTFPNYFELETTGMFHKVLLVNYSKYNGKSRGFILENIDAEFNSILPCKLEDVSRIYVGGAHYYFSLYLVNKGHRFAIFEDGAGLLSRHEMLETTIRNQKVLNAELLQEYGLFDMSNQFIWKKLCLMRAQKDGFDDLLAENFDVVEQFSVLKGEYQEKIKSFFRCPAEIPAGGNKILLLTQNFANLNQLSFENQVMIYQLLYDFFFVDYEWLIKPHPSDVLYYEKLFPDAYVIKEKFASELLPFIFDQIPKGITTISSTGIDLIEPLFEKKVKFGVDYEKDFVYIVKYYSALKALCHLGVQEFGLIGCNNVIISNLIEFGGEFKIQCNLNSISETVIVDEISGDDLAGLRKKKIVVFLNTKKGFEFTDEFSMDELYPIEITKSKFREEDNYCNLETEKIYIYSSQEVRDKLKKFSFSKRLEATGIELDISELSDTEIYMKSLEGQIEALEKRLLHYIKLSKEGNK